jgi:tetratricopeptide (TPR) repeat protein
MKYQQIFVAICFLWITVQQTHAQSSFKQDSLKLVSLTQGMDTYYTDPFEYQQRTFEAFPLVNKMIEQNPESVFLKKQRIEVYRLYQIFKKKELSFDESLNFILKNIENRKEINDTCRMSVSYRALGNFWRAQRNYEKAFSIMQEALAMANKCQHPEEMVKATIDIGRIYYAEKKFDSAKIFHIKALAIAKNHNFKGGIANANFQISRYYNHKKNFSESLKHLDIAKQYFQETNNISALERVNASYANHYRKNGQPQKAVAYFKQSIEHNLKLRDSSRLMNRYLGLSNSYHELKNYEGAYYSYLSYKKLQKKINDKKYYGQLIELEAKLNYAHQKKVDSLQFAKQKQLDESRIQQAADMRLQWFVVLFVALVLAFFIFYINSKHKQKEQAYQNILLNKKVATKTEEIQELLKETMKHIKSKEKIASDLQKFSKEKDGITLQSILAELKASKADDSKLVLIKENIEKINYEFLKTLKEKHPNLSKTEIEVSSFIKIGLSRKEIAKARGTSDYAVKTMRNRIRRKIGIDPSITLDDYLLSL